MTSTSTASRWLFVESYPHVVAGQQRTLCSLLERCPEFGIQPIVAVTGEGIFVEEMRRRGFDLEIYAYPETLGRYGGAVYRERGLGRLRLYIQWANYLWNIRRRLSASGVDGVYCNDMRGLLTVGVAARSLGLPVVLWDKLDKPHGWLDWLQLPLVRANPVISKAVTVKYPAWQRWYCADRIRVVPNGVDLSRFDTIKADRGRLPGAPGDVRLGIVGSITERKGQDRVLTVFERALATHPELRLFIVGETTGSAEDAAYLASLPLRDHPRVHFLGQQADVPAIMKALDLLLVPSRHEGMGQVTVEAMAARLPVIGTRAGGIPEVVVDGETGLLFEGESAEDLLRCIRLLAGDANLRWRMGQAGRARVEAHYDRATQHRKILELCLATAKDRKAGRP
jgi:glycosyltransferase involved in cell wall biosynthesis